jgi:hypothetical protein
VDETYGQGQNHKSQKPSRFFHLNVMTKRQKALLAFIRSQAKWAKAEGVESVPMPAMTQWELTEIARAFRKRYS